MGFDMHLAGDAHPVTERSQEMGQAAGVGPTGRVIPGTTVGQRVLARVKFGATRLTHGRRQVGLVENQSLLGKRIKMGSLGILTAVNGQVVVGAIIRHDDQDIRLLFGQAIAGWEGGRQHENHKQSKH